MIKLRVQYGRREGRPEFSSECAECSLEIEVDGALLENLADLHAKIAGVYEECRAAVDEQLRARPAVAPPVVKPPAAPIAPPAPVPPASPKPLVPPTKNGRSYGAPTSTRTFMGWFGSVDNPTRDRVKAIARNRGLGSLYREWSDEDAVAVYNAVLAGETAPPESDHERFMRRMAESKREDNARAMAFVNGTDG